MRKGAPIVALLIGLALCTTGFGQSDSTSTRAPVKPVQKNDNQGAGKNPAADQKAADKKPLPNVSNERSKELMAFVKEHHPELRPLLNSLQKTRPNQYQSTLRTLDREVRSLQNLESRSPERYKISLAHWITKSKITLLSAQLAIKKSLQEQQAIEKKIYELIQKQQDLQIEMVAFDTKFTEKRLAKYQADLAKLRENRTVEIQRRMDIIKNNSQRIRLAQQKAEDAKKKEASTKKKPTNEQPPAIKKDKSRLKDDPTNPQG
jgi:hypothetical protein